MDEYIINNILRFNIHPVAELMKTHIQEYTAHIEERVKIVCEIENCDCNDIEEPFCEWYHSKYGNGFTLEVSIPLERFLQYQSLYRGYYANPISRNVEMLIPRSIPVINKMPTITNNTTTIIHRKKNGKKYKRRRNRY